MKTSCGRGRCYCVWEDNEIPRQQTGSSVSSKLVSSTTSRRRRSRQNQVNNQPPSDSIVDVSDIGNQTVGLLSTDPVKWIKSQSRQNLILISKRETTTNHFDDEARRKIILCQQILPPPPEASFSSPLSSSSLATPVMVYDDTVQIVLSKPTTSDCDQEPVSSKSTQRMETLFQRLVEHCRSSHRDNHDIIWPLDDSNSVAKSFGSSATTTTTTVKSSKIQHGIPLQPITDSLSASLQKLHESSIGFAFPTNHPSATVIEPLQSLVVRLIEDSTNLPNGVGFGTDSTDVLLRSSWKRQLTGIVIAFSTTTSSPSTKRSPSLQSSDATATTVNAEWDDMNQQITTRIQVRLDERQRGDIHETSKVNSKQRSSCCFLQVESVAPLPISTGNTATARQLYMGSAASPSPIKTKDHRKDAVRFYVVLPSTKITILTNQQSTSSADPRLGPDHHIIANKNLEDYFQQQEQEESETPPSESAHRLLRTVRAIIAKRKICNGTRSVPGRTDPEQLDIPRSFLLSGPAGIGKTYTVRWIVQQTNRISKTPNSIILLSLRGSELLKSPDQGYGDVPSSPKSAGQVLEHKFETLVLQIKAVEMQSRSGSDPIIGLVFLDEFDALVSVDSMANVLASLLDRVSGRSFGGSGRINGEQKYWKQIVVVAATNLVDSIPAFLRNRFDSDLPMSPPSASDRARLLTSLLSSLKSTSMMNQITDDDVNRTADLCVGYVAADLTALVRRAFLTAVQRKNKEHEGSHGGGVPCLTYKDLDVARNSTPPSALRSSSLLVVQPNVSWEDIAGDPGGAKTALYRAIEWPRLHPDEHKLLGLHPPRGILLHGPPGCAKTSLARAAAGASGIAFLSLSPAEVYASSYVGEAEAIVRRSFALARNASPCILFFDEIDSLFGGNDENGSGGGSNGSGGRGHSAEARVLSTFLNEMDGVDIARKDGVLVIGATNRPWTLDSALLRPGRLGDKVIYLPPPDKPARRAIFDMQFRPLAQQTNMDDWDWGNLLDISKGMTGAEVVGACIRAKSQWLMNIPQINGDLGDVKDGMFESSMLQAELKNVSPILSDPASLEEFRLFQVH